MVVLITTISAPGQARRQGGDSGIGRVVGGLMLGSRGGRAEAGHISTTAAKYNCLFLHSATQLETNVWIVFCLA